MELQSNSAENNGADKVEGTSSSNGTVIEPRANLPSEKSGLNEHVAKHYNAVPETGLYVRTQSRIFYLRNFNNWIKSSIIKDALDRIRADLAREKRLGEPLTALDMCCGKGGDLLKWKDGMISHLVCTDIADVSLENCKSRYSEMVERSKRERKPQPLYSCEFINADLTQVRLKEKFSDKNLRFNLCSCQFSLHYSFSSKPCAMQMLQNACENLKPGGYFIGTIPNAEQLVYLGRKSDDMTFSNEVCSVKFEVDSLEERKIPLFGAKYHFTLDQVVNLPEYLVYFPLLVKLLKEFDMELVYLKTFADIVDEMVDAKKALLARMQGLEPYPPAENVELVSKDVTQYERAREKILELSANSESSGKTLCLGTLSKDEWDVATMYSAFMFRRKR